MPEFQLEVHQDGQTFIDEVREELIAYYGEMQKLRSLPLDEIFMSLAGWTARMSEVRSELTLRESKRSMALRTKHVEPFIEECDRQFKFYSRVQSVRDMEAKFGGSIT